MRQRAHSDNLLEANVVLADGRLVTASAIEDADAAFKPVRELKPAFGLLGPMPFPALQSLFD